MEWWTAWGKDALVAALALCGAGLSTVNWWMSSAKSNASHIYPLARLSRRMAPTSAHPSTASMQPIGDTARW